MIHNSCGRKKANRRKEWWLEQHVNLDDSSYAMKI
jgi:hypothetical protein